MSAALAFCAVIFYGGVFCGYVCHAVDRGKSERQAVIAALIWPISAAILIGADLARRVERGT